MAGIFKACKTHIFSEPNDAEIAFALVDKFTPTFFSNTVFSHKKCCSETHKFRI